MATFKQRLAARLPVRAELIPVYATTIFIIATWALYRMFFFVPSWLYYLNIWDVMVIGAYVLSYALFEAAVIVLALVLLGFILPKRIYLEQFVAQSMIILAASTGWALYLQRQVNALYKWNLRQLFLYPLGILISILAVVLVSALLLRRFQKLNSLINALADRMSIFAYIYVPLGLIGLVVVIVRNIF